MRPVFATALTVGFIEWACIQALHRDPEPGARTVDAHIDASHSAATPVGVAVTATVEPVAVDGRTAQCVIARTVWPSISRSRTPSTKRWKRMSSPVAVRIRS